MNVNSYAELADRELIEETFRAARAERQSTVTLIALLAEVDVRHLYLAEGCGSLFTYCTQVLHLSEHAAYHRIEAARAARRFPIILEMLAEGAISLTAIGLLRPHLTADNHHTLLTAARHKSKRYVEHQIACLAPRPDVKPLVRRLPEPRPKAAVPAHQTAVSSPFGDSPENASVDARVGALFDARVDAKAPSRPSRAATAHTRPMMTALGPERYLLKLTVSGETHAKLRRAQDLMRHTIPSGDPAAILDRALTMLVQHLERNKHAAAAKPRPTVRRSHGSSRSASQSTSQSTSRSARQPARQASPSASQLASQPTSQPAAQPASQPASRRRIAAAVRRAVWARDQGRCAFVGPHGRCTETGRLEFHHIIPFAVGGPTTVGNLALLCRAHNSYESEVWFGNHDWRDGAPVT